MQQQQSQNQTTVAASTPPSTAEEAPPKQVAQAMERLNHAGRLIADIRLGADRILEALFVAAEPHKSKPIELFVKEDSSMRQHIQDLRSIGKQLEESGVLSESIRLRSNSWGLHMPLVCPDGAVVAYAWKRQLAGQAGASAVDRTRLALKAFTDQKRHFFPHLDDELMETASKKQRSAQAHSESNEDEPTIFETLPDVLNSLAKEVSNLKILTHERLDWLKRASSLPASANDNSMEGPRHNFPGSSILRPAPQGLVASDKVTIIELFFPSIFRAIISVHPAGSIEPDAVAFFSPDEGGSYMHARGSSIYHVFKHITEHAALALQYFISTGNETALYTLLHWICTYQTLFSKSCCKCGRLLAIDRQSAQLLPPVYRPYRNFSASKSLSTGDQNANAHAAYHIGCYADQEA